MPVDDKQLVMADVDPEKEDEEAKLAQAREDIKQINLIQLDISRFMNKRGYKRDAVTLMALATTLLTNLASAGRTKEEAMILLESLWEELEANAVVVKMEE